MGETVKLNRVQGVLDDLEYPIPKSDAQAALSDVVVEYADGSEKLEEVVARSNEDTFETASDLEEEIFANVSIEAVGEPGQSEGDA